MLSRLCGGAGPGGLLMVADSLECEGRSLLKSLVSSAALRMEPVHVFALEMSVSDFVVGLDEAVRVSLRFDDGFSDPLHWDQSEAFSLDHFTASELVARICSALGESRGACTVVIDSLSWILQRKGVGSLCRELRDFQRKAVGAGLHIKQVLGLFHADLHQPEVLEVMGQMASAVVSLTTASKHTDPHRDFPPYGVATTLLRKKSGKVLKTVEYFTVDERLALRTSEVDPAKEATAEGDEATADPSANLTFNLQLTETERRAKEDVTLPFHFTPDKKASMLQGRVGEGKIFYQADAGDDFDEEDPDDDLYI
ncbi:elongator complex protein 5 [Narcine bancroftii]|uniref:elongator complex protein 5 n=1 Tax=Narcine bancroftii TaxID=1343680 RepID=UPI0038315FC3